MHENDMELNLPTGPCSEQFPFSHAATSVKTAVILEARGGIMDPAAGFIPPPSFQKPQRYSE
jgi:hypothetical protein